MGPSQRGRAIEHILPATRQEGVFLCSYGFEHTAFQSLVENGTSGWVIYFVIHWYYGSSTVEVQEKSYTSRDEPEEIFVCVSKDCFSLKTPCKTILCGRQVQNASDRVCHNSGEDYFSSFALGS